MSNSQTLPQYRQVAETLRRRIRNGVYRQGGVLPSLAELERIFDVSGITIRKALGLLAAEGRVSGRRGVGTVIIPRKSEDLVAIQVSGNFREWLESASGQSWPIAQEVLDIVTGPGPPHVARLLGAAEDDPLWRMRRVRRIEGEPISYHVNYGLPGRFESVGIRTMAPSRSFVEVMRKDLKIALARMDQRVEAIVADRDLADILEVDFGDPLFMVENRYIAEPGAESGAQPDEIVVVTLLFMRGDRYLYQSSLELNDSDPIA